MIQVVDAIYRDGVLEPVETLVLPQQQRVRLIVQSPDRDSDGGRQAGLARLRAGIASMNFRLSGDLPTRDELHGRF